MSSAKYGKDTKTKIFKMIKVKLNISFRRIILRDDWFQLGQKFKKEIYTVSMRQT